MADILASNDGHHQLRSRLSTPILARPWSKVDNPMYLDLAVACVSCLGDASEVSTQKVSFDKSKSQEEQIKQLEFMLGELRIDMQIFYERNCFPAPSVASVGSMTWIETKDAATQTDTHLGNNSSCCDIDTSDKPKINIPQSNDVPHEHINPQGVEYQAEILHLRQENDKYQRKNNEQKQTIGSLCHAIKQKNQLLAAAKVFIDAKIKNNENADIELNFADNLNHTNLNECQRCTLTSDLLAQTQLDKDKLNLQNNQLKKIVLSYETEIETLDRTLQQSIAKNMQCENSLDQIRNLNLELKSKNEIQTQEAHELQKPVAAIEIQRSNNDESNTQSIGGWIPAKSQIAIENALKSSKNEQIANPAVEDGFSSPVRSIENDASQCEQPQMATWQLRLKSPEIEPGNGEMDTNFREKCDILNEDPSMTSKKGTIPIVNAVKHGSKISIHNHDDDFVSKSICCAKPSAMAKHDQINWKPHLLPNSTKFTTDSKTRKRSITTNVTKKIAERGKTRRVEKKRPDKIIGVTKPKATDEKSRTSTARSLLNEKGNCHLTKQTTQNSVKGSNGRAISTRSHQSDSKINFLENRVISKSKTKRSNKHQKPKANYCCHSRTRDDDNWHKKRSSTRFAKQKENQKHQYANTDLGIKHNRKSINSQLVAIEMKNNRKSTSAAPLTTSQQPKKIDRKTCVPNILMRVVHEHEKKQHSKSLTTNVVDSLSTSTSTSKPRPVDARADRLHYLCQMITERNSIDLLSLDDLKFLNENLDDVTLSEQITVFVSKMDLQERLRQIQQFEKQMQKSKESLGKWCSIS